MIKDRINKIGRIENVISSDIQQINYKYRNGPDLYFYRKVVSIRKDNKIKRFLESDYNIELLYATLVAWDMNSRAAKMKYFDDFKANIHECINEFEVLEKVFDGNYCSFDKVCPVLKKAYSKLELMKTNRKLVSNSKLLHFLFPEYLMPVDGLNTLNYFYDNSGESPQKYLYIIEASFEIILNQEINWENVIDNQWNLSPSKAIDNAIILLVGKSLKST